MIIDLSLFPVSSFVWVLHETPSGHPWCLPATLFPQLLPIERAQGIEDRFLLFLSYCVGDSFFLRWVSSPGLPELTIMIALCYLHRCSGSIPRIHSLRSH